MSGLSTRFSPRRSLGFLVAAAAFCSVALPAAAAPDATQSGVYVQAGQVPRGDGASALTLGYVTPFLAPRNWWGGEVTSYWDASVGYIRSDADVQANGGERSIAILGLKPTFRWRGDNGGSPWFWEAGVGLSYLNGQYVARDQQFGSRFNFATHIGVGYSFGARAENELALRLEHISNAGIKDPNPGDNFLQLRYTRKF